VRVAKPKVIDVDGLIGRAHALSGLQNKADRALAIVDRALRLSPDHAGALVLKGQLLADLGRTTAARRLFDRAIVVHPKLPHAYVECARLLYAIDERFEEALRFVKRGLRRIGRDRQLKGEALRLQGHILDELDRSAEALNAYRLAIRLDRSDPEAHEALGDTLLTLGKPAEAIQEFDTALNLLRAKGETSDEDIVFVLISKADGLAMLGRPLEAVRMLHQYLSKARDSNVRAFLKTAVTRVSRFYSKQCRTGKTPYKPTERRGAHNR
jgi:tetratricopeptide (TPR) repeat protein